MCWSSGVHHPDDDLVFMSDFSRGQPTLCPCVGNLVFMSPMLVFGVHHTEGDLSYVAHWVMYPLPQESKVSVRRKHASLQGGGGGTC